MKQAIAGAAALVLLVPLLVVLFLSGDTSCTPRTAPGAGGTAVVIDPASLPVQKVDNWNATQLTNAAYIMKAAADMGLPAKAQTIGVMTAIGESSLDVIDRGDAAGPDSRGLFQQRANGSWGSYEDRMDPYRSASSFFKVLATVDGWEILEPTIAAHRVQRNADPEHYAKFWEPATKITAALTGMPLPEGDSAQGCVAVDVSGWTSPLDLASPGLMIADFYGARPADVIGYAYKHNGVDLSTPVGTKIHAAAAGTVTKVVTDQGFSKSGLGNLIIVSHGGGIFTRYHHIKDEGVLVAVGDRVEAGDVIALSGNSGTSTGPHLHYTVYTGGDTKEANAVDPITFMQDRNINFCTLPIWSGHSVASTC
jgi:murein DD-endopeptidase MepM/ murein hydrolase activator NlpD